MNIHALNEFLSHDFFCWLEIAAFAYLCTLVLDFVLSLHPANAPMPQGVCAATLAPIFEEAPQIKTQAPTLSDLIREEVGKAGIRELRQIVREKGLQSQIKAVTGKSVARCTVAELRRAIA